MSNTLKAVIAAGGSGTRLRPLTTVTNKHLLPVYNKPVIFYAIEKLVNSGIDRIMIVTSKDEVDTFIKLLGSGEAFTSANSGKQIQITYGIQNKPNGFIYCMYIAKEYIGDDNCALYLGDNIFEDDLSKTIREFKTGATVFLKDVPDPKRFGIATIKDGLVVGVTEKPKQPKSNLAVTGLYLFDNSIFKKIAKLKPSARGELEGTHVLNQYIREKALTAHILRHEWFDVGTFDNLLRAGVYMQDKSKHGEI